MGKCPAAPLGKYNFQFLPCDFSNILSIFFMIPRNAYRQCVCWPWFLSFLLFYKEPTPGHTLIAGPDHIVSIQAIPLSWIQQSTGVLVSPGRGYCMGLPCCTIIPSATLFHRSSITDEVCYGALRTSPALLTRWQVTQDLVILWTDKAGKTSCVYVYVNCSWRSSLSCSVPWYLKCHNMHPFLMIYSIFCLMGWTCSMLSLLELPGFRKSKLPPRISSLQRRRKGKGHTKVWALYTHILMFARCTDNTALTRLSNLALWWLGQGASEFGHTVSPPQLPKDSRW